MPQFEFRVVPAPRRGVKEKGAKTTEERFARALEQVMNEMGAQGWDYVRSDVLPCEERTGLTGKATTYQTMLVFRRVTGAAEGTAPHAAPPVMAPVVAPVVQPVTVPSFMAPAPRAVEAPLNPAPPLGGAERPAAE